MMAIDNNLIPDAQFSFQTTVCILVLWIFIFWYIEYTSIWEYYLHKMESLQGPKEHWQLKQRKSCTSYKRFLKLEVFHQSVSCANYLIHSIACSVLWCWGMYGEWSKLIWGNWESPVPVLQIYTTSAHKSIHCCSNDRTGMIPPTTTHPTKSNQVFCLPPATKYRSDTL